MKKRTKKDNIDKIGSMFNNESAACFSLILPSPSYPQPASVHFLFLFSIVKGFPGKRFIRYVIDSTLNNYIQYIDKTFL